MSITAVIFVLIGIGYASVACRFFSADEMRTLGKFVVSIALPALVFRAVSSRPIAEISNVGYLSAVLCGSLAVFAAGYLWARRIAGHAPAASTFHAMGMSCANSGFIGYPVLLMALPSVASPALAMNMIVENLVMIPLVLALAEKSRQGDGAPGAAALRIAGRLLRSPIVIALICGMAVSVGGLTLPTVITRPVEILAAASAALSLAVIGGTLAGLPLRSFDATVVAVIVGKLVLHPLAVLLALGLLSAIGWGVEDAGLRAAAVIMAAMPVMGIYPILAQRFGEEQGAAAAMFAMTVVSFFTMSAALMLVLP
ncbi:AEC family transporter [Roseivivax sp. CAU 1761]